MFNLAQSAVFEHIPGKLLSLIKPGAFAFSSDTLATNDMLYLHCHLALREGN